MSYLESESVEMGAFFGVLMVVSAWYCSGMPGGRSCPKLVMGKGSARVVIGQDSSEILRYADKSITKEEDRLYPSDPEQLQLVQSWGVFNFSFGGCLLNEICDHCET